MTRDELEHIIRASGDITDQYRVQNTATGDRVGYCLDVIDLFMSKAAAARDKDREFCVALLAHGYVTQAQALELVSKMPMDVEQQRRLRATIRRWSGVSAPGLQEDLDSWITGRGAK